VDTLTDLLSSKELRDARGDGEKLVTVEVLDFTESWILSEMLYRHLSDHAFSVEELGDGEPSLMTFFRSEHNDLFILYSGTGMPSVANDAQEWIEALNRVYAKWSLKWLNSSGFENKELLIMNAAKADQLKIVAMSDLKDRSVSLVFEANRNF
tara:strand:+ start:451 stop:909 length:459 start_codon:yes stop_codon:yes gene_type:complete